MGNKQENSRNGGASDFIWNLVGGAMVSAMIAGVMYVLVGMMASFLNHNDKMWDLFYLKWYFIAVLVIYLVMPTVLANVIGFVFGSTSKASGSRRKIG